MFFCLTKYGPCGNKMIYKSYRFQIKRHRVNWYISKYCWSIWHRQIQRMSICCYHLLLYYAEKFLVYNWTIQNCLQRWLDGLVWLMVFNASFNTISVISWRFNDLKKAPEACFFIIIIILIMCLFIQYCLREDWFKYTLYYGTYVLLLSQCNSLLFAISYVLKWIAYTFYVYMTK